MPISTRRRKTLRKLARRIQLHRELERLRAKAAAEQAKLRGSFRQAPFPIGLFEGEDHRIVLANAKWEELVGRPLPEGMRLEDAVPELRAQGILSWHDRAFSGETIVARDVPLQLVTDGELRQHYFHVVLQPLFDDRGERHGHVTMALDVTDQVRAKTELDAARRGAEAASRAKDEFLAMLGHELRNPLSPMLTALQIMRMQGKTSREQEVLERQVGHLTRLVDDLLDVSRITRGKIELRRRAIDVADVVARAVELSSPLLEQRRHKLDLRVPRGIVGNLDVDRIAQVIANLLTNAAKYSDPGSTILVEAAQSGDRARIRVEDEGVGIEPAMLDRVFELFVQRPQTLDRAQGGLGLGLAIVKSLVEMHGGSVFVRSEGDGRGSEFTVELPVLEAKHEGAAGAEEGASSREEERGLRVLVVDDNVDSAEMLKAALEFLGFIVEMAHDGVAALEIAGRFAPEIALVDIGLPVMNGYELAPRLREVHPGKGLWLLAVTGYGQEEDRRRSRDAGFDEHLVKPVDLALLEKRLKAIEASARAARSRV